MKYLFLIFLCLIISPLSAQYGKETAISKNNIKIRQAYSVNKSGTKLRSKETFNPQGYRTSFELYDDSGNIRYQYEYANDSILVKSHYYQQDTLYGTSQFNYNEIGQLKSVINYTPGNQKTGTYTLYHYTDSLKTKTEIFENDKLSMEYLYNYYDSGSIKSEEFKKHNEKSKLLLYDETVREWYQPIKIVTKNSKQKTRSKYKLKYKKNGKCKNPRAKVFYVLQKDAKPNQKTTTFKLGHPVFYLGSSNRILAKHDEIKREEYFNHSGLKIKEVEYINNKLSSKLLYTYE